MFGHLSDPDVVASPLTWSHYKQRHQRLYSRKLPLMLIDVIYAQLIPQYAHPISQATIIRHSPQNAKIGTPIRQFSKRPHASQPHGALQQCPSCGMYYRQTTCSPSVGPMGLQHICSIRLDQPSRSF